MKIRRSTPWIILAIVLILGLALASCQAPATPAPEKTAPPPPAQTEPPAQPTAPPPTEKPAATEAPAATQPPAGGPKIATITYTGGDPESLNPLYAYSWTAENVFDLNLLPLWNIDNDNNYVMELAQELPSKENGGLSEDGLTITYKLRPEAQWSDGTPVTAQDAVFTYEMIMSEKNASYSRYPWDTYVESVTAVDDHTLQIKLTSPYADWATSFFVGLSRVIPKHILQPVFEKDGTLDNAEWNRLPTVGSGPFNLVEYEPASHLIFEANENYWRGRPKLDEIHMRLVEDRAAQMAALAAGESDIGTYIIGSELPDLNEMGNMEIQTSINGLQVTIFENVDPNTAHPAMTDPNVRRALQMAIDRNLINSELYNGLYEVPATYWHGSAYADPQLKAIPYDPDSAKKLLDEAGWVDANSDGVREKDGKDLALRYAYISGDETTDTMVVAIQQMLADAGVKVDLFPNTSEVLWASFEDSGPLALGQYDLTHWSDGMAYFPSPDTSYFLCDQRPTAENPYGYNWFGICIPEMDELFKQQAVELDPQKRIEMFYQIGKIMYDQTLLIPLHTDPDVWAVNTRLANVRFSGVDPLMFAYEWDVK